MESNKIALTVISVAALIGAAPFVISQTSVETQNVEFKPQANVTIVDNSTENVSLGVAPGGEGLDFGQMPLQATKRARKTVKLNSSKKALALTTSSGNISEFLEYEEKIYFEGLKEVEIKFRADEPGYYNGTLRMKILTPKNEVGKKWLDLRSRLYF